MSNYAGPETREKGRIETWNPNTNLNQKTETDLPSVSSSSELLSPSGH